ncbi:hypothetical protein ALC57_06177 [Trachymyrmex cornetzi]|uniref:Uncharacterized protein n=1 Tax=Trachymyrmex cornetzi TaxID=471704 RepID=A0A151J997_9HYME|nr:hypothetical protein ALC57_06177 [Trachymyrmex cornetzi]
MYSSRSSRNEDPLGATIRAISMASRVDSTETLPWGHWRIPL